MEKTWDVTALGELLVDFTEWGESPQGNPLFEANPGGAPCNLLAMLARLGHPVAFLGKVGEDLFGRLLRERAAAAGIDVAGVRSDPQALTTLAFVRNGVGGEREFSFYRRPGADELLRPEEVDLERVVGCRVFHFGTLSMTNPCARAATEAAVEAARAAGCISSFDPNLRRNLWDDLGRAREAMAWGVARCDVLKLADDELEFFTGEADLDRGAAALLREWQGRLLLVTLGARGSVAWYGGERVFVPACRRADTVDTTGAGDTFGGCALHFVLRYGLEGLDRPRMEEMLRTANAAASLVTARKGALAVMPKGEEVLAWRREWFGE